jgi:membrane protein YdbS with pleckstrin-like domain
VDAEEGLVMREEITRDIDVRGSSVALWFGVLSGPLAFLIDLQVKYGMVTYVCRNRAEWIFWAAAAVSLFVTIVGGFVSWRHWGSDDRRVHFMAISGVIIDAMFALSIIAMAIPDLFIKACD